MLILPIPIRAAYRDRSRRPVALVGSKSFGSLRRFGFGLGKELARLLSLRRALSGCTSASQLQNPSFTHFLNFNGFPLHPRLPSYSATSCIYRLASPLPGLSCFAILLCSPLRVGVPRCCCLVIPSVRLRMV